ncbi:Asp23/Gls24 family envelope stress response protein [Streptomyces sp. ME02-6979-3A]|uniref:Asp23/Gls24 family envelope stress response protein n=1 Tax=Streptomyces silvae TaxID=2803812 RepID=A0ABU8A0U5_9ACTN|nr:MULTISPECIES: Asp23/Gls24 family envelope stress response protein [unclassified Streptomyces]WSS69012.1 Asp23/Gls24 family envelope stress response protein [Streptomyces sp. NBC_01175]WSS76023.1 Asp23/Gls24 family envelope stress response protein [Streptomyces sp. NBC_01174]MDX3326134.1 Asp23/Gls24 family envelope stress response protein [Streptomyces sp. ME02-6979-3A]MDX3687348.1 Asp23/Gls24 family envelope stress response protein [Streptomyces sp. AK04-4c]RPK44190.1 Alkaline shock protein
MADVESLGGSSTTGRNGERSGRGRTTIADGVVATIAGIAIRETEGVHSVGRGASKALGAVAGRVPGSSSGGGRGVKVEVGEKQTAVDVDIEVEYGIPIHELADRIRTQVTDAVETMTGLEVVEININVFDVHVPDEDDDEDEDENRSRSSARVQ